MPVDPADDKADSDRLKVCMSSPVAPGVRPGGRDCSSLYALKCTSASHGDSDSKDQARRRTRHLDRHSEAQSESLCPGQWCPARASESDSESESRSDPGRALRDPARPWPGCRASWAADSQVIVLIWPPPSPHHASAAGRWGAALRQRSRASRPRVRRPEPACVRPDSESDCVPLAEPC